MSRTIKSETIRTKWIWMIGLVTLIVVLLTRQLNELFLFMTSYAKFSIGLLIVHISWIALFGRYDCWQMYEDKDPDFGKFFTARMIYYGLMMYSIAIIR